MLVHDSATSNCPPFHCSLRLCARSSTRPGSTPRLLPGLNRGQFRIRHQSQFGLKPSCQMLVDQHIAIAHRSHNDEHFLHQLHIVEEAMETPFEGVVAVVLAARGCLDPFQKGQRGAVQTLLWSCEVGGHHRVAVSPDACQCTVSSPIPCVGGDRDPYMAQLPRILEKGLSARMLCQSGLPTTERKGVPKPVSYTHLTLPTILRV